MDEFQQRGMAILDSVARARVRVVSGAVRASVDERSSTDQVTERRILPSPTKTIVRIEAARLNALDLRIGRELLFGLYCDRAKIAA